MTFHAFARPAPFRAAVCTVLTAAALLAPACGRDRPADAGSLVTARTLGLAYLQTDQLAEAEAQFKRVIALAPNEALGHANLALTYLRGGRLQDAEAEAVKARAIDSTAANIALIVAGVYAAQGRAADARAVLDPLARAGSDDPAVLFALAQLDTSAAAADARAGLLRRILAKAPTNLAVRMAQLGAFVARGQADSATRAIEEIRRMRPEPPREALAPYAAALPLLRAGRLADARPALDRFRAAMEFTPAYQSSLRAVKGPDGPMVGRPALTFSPRLDVAQRVTSLGKAVADAVQLTDVTADLKLAPAGAGAPTTGASAVAAGDFDGDGEDDLFVSEWDGGARAFVPSLYVARKGTLEDVTTSARLALPGGATFAIWADYDNDGWLDLFAIGANGRGHLFRNAGGKRLDDVTARAGVGDVGGATKAAFVDIDHDGDLDLVVVGPNGVRAFQNRGDGTFSDETAAYGLNVAPAAPAGRTVPAAPAGVGPYDIAFADFDGDGRTDLLVSRGAAGLTLFRNAGARRFEDATAASGLAAAGAAGAFAVGDYDNDGAFDVVVAPPGAGDVTVWHNKGDGTFTRDTRRSASLAPLRTFAVSALRFADYDNDGWLDVIAAGTPAGAGTGLRVFHSDAKAAFDDRSSLVPATVGPATALAITDLGNDGDDDFIVASAATGPRAVRNTGGNANLYVQVRLSALRTGSGKNNDFGIGSRVELRVGDVVQTRTVTSATTLFGLGAHLKADVLRVEWTNGVPQVIYFPGSDQDVLENEVLKSSCGFLYAWNGERFEFVTDVMWRSALGMPMGLMAGGTAWAPAGASQEYLTIPGSALSARDGRYVLQLTEELWETSYTDEVRLIAVDHPDSVTVHVDERFVPPGPVSLRLYNAVNRHPPLSAVDGRGRDVLPALREKDDVYVSDLVATEFQGIVEPHDLVMDLGPDAGAPGTSLYLRGWIYPTDASINVALSQQSRITPMLPALEVRDASGAWRKAADVGFPSGKDKTIVVDLAGQFPTKDHHVRIRTNMQIYWDQAFVATDAPRSPVKMTTLTLERADLHFRGVSEMYRKGGRYGPQWFDYSKVIREPVWRPITGNYTRFGDVLPLLGKPDDMYVVMAPGDETTLTFDANIPPPPAGWTRDFLLYSDGWIKDADLNTALGNTVGPLPFHGIKSYPPQPGDAYPADAAHQRYLREYNTRVIGRR
ncbi:MAG: FG-GAP-like repeat-containing protein [Gemmatimonadota bacterium]|nr:FG-GAP-like repeat-containing protein [Gemmatimonadota bacterium]